MTEPMEPNRIPAAPIVEVIRSYLGSQGKREYEGGFTAESVYKLAERADMNGDTLQKILIGRMKTIDFDVADRLLCVTNLTDLWRTSLADVYEAAHLAEGEKKFRPARVSGAKVCARPTCSDSFVPKPKNPHQRFCSSKCAAAVRRIKLNPESKVLGKGRILLKLECLKGHPRTPENTRYTDDGRMYCVECKRKQDRDNARRRYVPLGRKGNHGRKLTAETAAQIRAADGVYRDIAAQFGVSRTTVSVVKAGKTWDNVS